MFFIQITYSSSIHFCIQFHFITAFYGVLFPYTQEAAFSNYRLWESLGFTFAFAYSNYICVWIKLTILITMLAIGMLGYFLTEFKIRNSRELPAKEGADDDKKNGVALENGVAATT